MPRAYPCHSVCGRSSAARASSKAPLRARNNAFHTASPAEGRSSSDSNHLITFKIRSDVARVTSNLVHERRRAEVIRGESGRLPPPVAQQVRDQGDVPEEGLPLAQAGAGYGSPIEAVQRPVGRRRKGRLHPPIRVALGVSVAPDVVRAPTSHRKDVAQLRRVRQGTSQIEAPLGQTVPGTVEAPVLEELSDPVQRRRGEVRPFESHGHGCGQLAGLLGLQLLLLGASTLAQRCGPEGLHDEQPRQLLAVSRANARHPELEVGGRLIARRADPHRSPRTCWHFERLRTQARDLLSVGRVRLSSDVHRLLQGSPCLVPVRVEERGIAEGLEGPRPVHRRGGKRQRELGLPFGGAQGKLAPGLIRRQERVLERLGSVAALLGATTPNVIPRQAIRLGVVVGQQVGEFPPPLAGPLLDPLGDARVRLLSFPTREALV